MVFENYNSTGFYDELFDENQKARAAAMPLVWDLSYATMNDIKKKQLAAETLLMQTGVTFTVYGDKRSTEKIMPFDIIPRIVSSSDWDFIERGLKQRIHALNLFLSDCYGEKKIFETGLIPPDLIFKSEFYIPQLDGFRPPKDVWVHISGIDLVRGGDGEYYILEDNLRCPSGVSYVLENREVLKRTFPKVFNSINVRPVSNYPSELFNALKYLVEEVENPTIVVLTPGVYNSAYFEHSYLAQQMGVELVEGSDLIVRDDVVYMKTTKGLKKVDVIYRRIDDEYIDPKFFRPDSMLGVPGIMSAYLAGNVALVNAPGVGIADDKVVYSYVPEIIKFYLGEEPILKNVPTYLCWREADRKYVIDNIEKLVVKAATLSGGYGLLIGPHSTKEQQQDFINKINEDPRNYIAQHVINLSTVPTITDDGLQPRHVDLRPYIIYGKETYISPGGLTRVALRKGSLVVNSSQGGGSKDTWVVA